MPHRSTSNRPGHTGRIQACNLCQFWQPETHDRDTARVGECRRHAPAPHVMSARDGAALELKGVRVGPMWAMTSHDDWCGDFDGVEA